MAVMVVVVDVALSDSLSPRPQSLSGSFAAVEWFGSSPPEH